jgi:NADH-quinone oxidoreductase subunit F
MAIKETRIILKNVDQPGYTTDIECYMRHGGYETIKKALKMKPEEIRQEIKDSEIRGRGGAGFLAGVKWGFLDYKSGKPIYLICNADESEPGTFKDRQIMYKDPHQLIEAMVINAYAIQAKFAVIYIRGEMYEGAKILEKAIEEARAKHFVGDKISGTDFSCNIVVTRGAGAYICGEETGLIESIEGKRPYPRIKPPYFPAVLGLYHSPTIVNNVETICHIMHALKVGGKEYAKIGTPNNTGTRIWSISGHVQKPGYYEFPCGGITMGQLIFDVAGGLFPGRTLKAVIPGGTSAKVLKADERFKGKLKDGTEYDWSVLDIPLDFDSFSMCGTMSGSAAVIVMDDTTDIVQALANINAFYSHESCGQCTPCREGSLWMHKITKRMVAGGANVTDPKMLKEITRQIEGRTICAFGEACSWPTSSFVTKFQADFDAYANGSRAKGMKTSDLEGASAGSNFRLI